MLLNVTVVRDPEDGPAALAKPTSKACIKRVKFIVNNLRRYLRKLKVPKIICDNFATKVLYVNSSNMRMFYIWKSYISYIEMFRWCNQLLGGRSQLLK